MPTDAHGFLSGKRLVIFGAGYIGSALARAAKAQGVRVTALTRNPVVADGLRAGGIETVVADLASEDWHDRVAADIGLAVNCVSSGGGGAEAYRHSYVGGMRSVLAWGRRLPKAGTLIYTGSTSVYPQDGGVRVGEEASVVPAEGNAAILLEAEALALGFSATSKVLRLAGLYGPGRHHLLDQLLTGAAELPGIGTHHLNLVHRDDVVEAILLALAAPAGTVDRIFNVADDGAAPKAEMVAWLAQRLGRPVPTFNGSAAQGRRRVTPDRIIANDRIKRALGWRPRFASFRDGYADLLDGVAGDRHAGH